MSKFVWEEGDIKIISKGKVLNLILKMISKKKNIKGDKCQLPNKT